MSALVWMKRYIEEVGDKQPNLDGEIHMDYIAKKEIYLEYYESRRKAHEPYIRRSLFHKIWKSCFPHVRIRYVCQVYRSVAQTQLPYVKLFRRYKNVCGKCVACMLLSLARQTHTDRESRQYISEMAALHKGTFMGEREGFAERKEDAIRDPNAHISLISDGMAQTHCLLPYLGNQDSFSTPLSQHFQGMVFKSFS